MVINYLLFLLFCKAILFECITTITCIYSNEQLLNMAVNITSSFLLSEISNIKYIGFFLKINDFFY